VLPVRLEGLHVGGNEVDAVECEGVGRRAGHDEMAEVNRIERAAEDAAAHGAVRG
jgi:hypothetical protein